MDAMHAVDVSEQITRLRQSAELRHQTHIARTVVKEPDLRAVLVVVGGGTDLRPHQPDESVILEVLDGFVRVHLFGKAVPAPAGTILTLAPGELHQVEAVQDSAFLLVLPWPTQSAGASCAQS